jgi:glycosyltransferase involved in cell wall biosynthesis
VTKPIVSVLVPTYGRVRLLEEVLESFIRQDTDVRREIIVLNDREDQFLEYNGHRPINADVHIVNAQDRIKTLGEKRNILAQVASGEFITYWDDDDVPLVNNISHHLKYICNDGVYSNKLIFQRDAGKIPRVIYGRRLWLVSLLVSRSYYQEAGGCRDITGYEDRDASTRLSDRRVVDVNEVTPYLYRWQTGSRHTSGGFNLTTSDNDMQAAGHVVMVDMESDVTSRQCSLTEPVGHVELKPTWRYDYTRLCADGLAADDDYTIDLADYQIK